MLLSGTKVECVLWDEYLTESYSDYIMNDETPVVVVMNLARIGFSIDGVYLIYCYNIYSVCTVVCLD